MFRLARAFQAIAILGLILLGLITLPSCQKKDKETSTTPISVNAIKLSTHEIPVYIDYIGITNAINTVTIRARVKGFLTQVDFVEGSFVKKGELLFIIDPRTYKAQLDQAKAQLDLSIARAEFQKVEYERMKRLVVTGAVSKERFDMVTAQYQEALALVKSNKAKVEEAELNLSFCYMYSPLDGKIGQKFVDVGNMVGGTTETELATIVQLNPMYIDFSPSVNDFSEILKYRENAPFDVSINIPGLSSLKFSGTVDLVNNEADQNTSTILTRAIFENPKNLLLPGIYVNVRLFLGKNPNAILVPSQAILDMQGQQFVYLVDGNNKVVLQKISSTQVYKGQNVITKGLKVGDIVIINNLQNIKGGDSVSPKITSSEIK